MFERMRILIQLIGRLERRMQRDVQLLFWCGLLQDLWRRRHVEADRAQGRVLGADVAHEGYPDGGPQEVHILVRS